MPTCIKKYKDTKGQCRLLPARSSDREDEVAVYCVGDLPYGLHHFTGVLCHRNNRLVNFEPYCCDTHLESPEGEAAQEQDRRIIDPSTNETCAKEPSCSPEFTEMGYHYAVTGITIVVAFVLICVCHLRIRKRRYAQSFASSAPNGETFAFDEARELELAAQFGGDDRLSQRLSMSQQARYSTNSMSSGTQSMSLRMMSSGARSGTSSMQLQRMNSGIDSQSSQGFQRGRGPLTKQMSSSSVGSSYSQPHGTSRISQSMPLQSMRGGGTSLRLASTNSNSGTASMPMGGLGPRQKAVPSWGPVPLMVSKTATDGCDSLIPSTFEGSASQQLSRCRSSQQADAAEPGKQPSAAQMSRGWQALRSSKGPLQKAVDSTPPGRSPRGQAELSEALKDIAPAAKPRRAIALPGDSGEDERDHDRGDNGKGGKDSKGGGRSDDWRSNDNWSDRWRDDGWSQQRSDDRWKDDRRGNDWQDRGNGWRDDRGGWHDDRGGKGGDWDNDRSQGSGRGGHWGDVRRHMREDHHRGDHRDDGRDDRSEDKDHRDDGDR